MTADGGLLALGAAVVAVWLVLGLYLLLLWRTQRRVADRLERLEKAAAQRADNLNA